MSLSPAKPVVSKALARAGRVDYTNRTNALFRFAGEAQGEEWNGLFLMGLSLFNLDLIPYSSDITPRPYWKTAPEPKGGAKDWDISWIAERDAFTGDTINDDG